jgi:hypothetical protein
MLLVLFTFSSRFSDIPETDPVSLEYGYWRTRKLDLLAIGLVIISSRIAWTRGVAF